MIPSCPPSSLPSPRSDTSYLSTPDSLKCPMLASDRNSVNFTRAPSKHRDFYLDDGNVVFLVGNTYFKVHRFFFQRDSQFFRDTFDCSPTGVYTIDDLLTFTDVTSLDFERFLGVLYPKDFSKPTATTVDEWTSILDLAMRWGFRSIQLLAIEQLTLLASPIDKIVLGRKYHVTEWLRDAYRAVCEREHSLTLDEGQRLGVQEIINISYARQAIRREASLVTPFHLNVVIEETFKLGVVPDVLDANENAFNDREVDAMEKDSHEPKYEIEVNGVEKDIDEEYGIGHLDKLPDNDDKVDEMEFYETEQIAELQLDGLIYGALAEEIESPEVLISPLTPPTLCVSPAPSVHSPVGHPRSRQKRYRY